MMLESSRVRRFKAQRQAVVTLIAHYGVTADHALSLAAVLWRRLPKGLAVAQLQVELDQAVLGWVQTTFGLVIIDSQPAARLRAALLLNGYGNAMADLARGASEEAKAEWGAKLAAALLSAAPPEVPTPMPEQQLG